MPLCSLCPRKCLIDRSQTSGFCQGGVVPKVACVVVHKGEEPPLVQKQGSGTIFFSGCTLRCSYCQNMQLSRYAYGKYVSIRELAKYMIMLQGKGCSNINLVTPTHYSTQIIEALNLARQMGLHLPVVFNSSGYERIDTLKMWQGEAHIYLMDLKYGDNYTGKLLSGVDDYWDRARQAIAYLWDAQGELVCDSSGRAQKGVMVRHLVLPGMLSNPFAVLEFLSGLSLKIPISIMAQYTPVYYQGGLPEMKRSVREEEYHVVLEEACDLGFETIFAQDMEADQTYLPDFIKVKPFGDQENLLA